MDKNNSNALVVGAGISGIRTALDLAQQDFHVTLIDKSPAIGGILSQLDYQFPSNHCGMCKMLPLINRDASSQFCLRKGLFHENIHLLLSCELSGLAGEAGNFTARLRQKPTWVDPDLCVGCGLCEKVCPQDIPDCFNEGLSSRKAIYLPVPHAIPNAYVIDLAACNRCGACEEVCPTNAIQLSQSNRKAFNILVVDDELSIRDSLKEWLEEEDFSVDMAVSGADALTKLSQKPYQLMLTDIKMPQMGGVELLKKAKKDHPNLSVVMMTAYATVETAVEAMKIGALDYLIKPFDPDTLVPMVIRIFQDIEATKDREITIDTIIFSTGTSFYDPADEKNIFGYGIYPNVLTSIEFERMISHTGPSQGALCRLDHNPNDQNDPPVKKIAWIQCVGSRNIQQNADFCSSICCMIAIKEAVLTREISKGKIDTTIFYMDMRTFGKSFQRYYDTALSEHGVRFERCKIDSISLDKKTNDLIIRYISKNGELKKELFDMAVLSTGQRPSYKTAQLAKICDLSTNPWGFIQTLPFSLTLTAKEGIIAGGSVTGLKDISQSLIQASAAAQNAGCIIHSKGSKKLEAPIENKGVYRDVSREPVDLLMVICTCKERVTRFIDPKILTEKFIQDPCISNVIFLDNICTDNGWQELEQIVMDCRPNRLLIGACHPYLYIRRIRELAKKCTLDPVFIDVVDIMTGVFQENPDSQNELNSTGFHITGILNAGAAALKQAQYQTSHKIPVHPSALIIGGGIAGMTAALGIADQGYEVALVEKTDHLGGNLNWLKQTIDGLSCENLLEETIARVTKQPLIRIFLNSQIISCTGYTGQFKTIIEDGEKQPVTIEHGAVILATGGNEARTQSFNYGTQNSVVTQKDLEIRLADKSIDPKKLDSIAMIQCVDSRQEPRNYCSRVCCPTALKQARFIKEQNPEADIYFLYRDMMTCGFTETFFTQARKDNIIFISYEPDNLPQVEEIEGKIIINAVEPVLGRPIEINADLVVLATGITPEFPDTLASILGIMPDMDRFFQEADPKWRPLDAIKEGIYACGIVHSPGSIPESIATAQAAAQRALNIISRPVLASAQIVALVRHSLCSLCQRCIDTCPYGARMLNTDETKVLVNEAMCQGCGACAVICPNNASVLQGYSGQQMLGVIDAVFEDLLN
ncbi:MAG: FAD-dependent oxidoreductase [Desulfobacteraceae bacterium]|nr:FAD-dependent oxidoreductase [Desulfobacteraceae bacterium]MBC2754179.1 FAD-dependent oxidoreductase [Desulfobacteraceae bacterium]